MSIIHFCRWLKKKIIIQNTTVAKLNVQFACRSTHKNNKFYLIKRKIQKLIVEQNNEFTSSLSPSFNLRMYWLLRPLYPKILLRIFPKIVFSFTCVDSICSYVFFSSASWGPQSTVGLSALRIFYRSKKSLNPIPSFGVAFSLSPLLKCFPFVCTPHTLPTMVAALFQRPISPNRLLFLHWF